MTPPPRPAGRTPLPLLLLFGLLLAFPALPRPCLGGERLLASLPPDPRLHDRHPRVADFQGSTIMVKLYRDREAGEESGPPDTWPRETILAEVRPLAGGEGVLYQLDLAFGWRFIAWGQGEGKGPPSSGTQPESLFFRMARREVNRTDPGQLWEEQEVLVKVGMEGATVRDEDP